MLERILEHLHNWFVLPGGVHTGKYTVENGGIVLPFVLPGQYFRVRGSVFNDGLHKYPETGMADEEFTGEVWALAVPHAVEELAGEVRTWCNNNPATQYVSESFGGYSRTVGANQRTGMPLTWEDAFRGRLNAWRKLP